MTTRVTPSAYCGRHHTLRYMNTVVSSSWPRITASARSHPRLGVHLTPHLILCLAVVVAALAIAYLISLRLRPYVTCRRCHGVGKVRGFFFSWARDFCPKCGGDGIVPRLGSYLLAAAYQPRMLRRLGR